VSSARIASLCSPSFGGLRRIGRRFPLKRTGLLTVS